MSTVVVVDDDDIVRGFLERVLCVSGYDVLAFSDAADMIEAVDFDAVDLLLTDQHMPTPGDVAVKTLRARGIDVPVVVLSGNLDCETIEIFNKMGVREILPKPIDMKVLVVSVENAIGSR